MATIKLQDGKVVLKDGKVSCGCCAQPGACCMYPAQELFDGILSSNDLPDQIVFNWREPGGPIISTVINRSESRYETNVGTTNLLVEIQVNGSDVFWYSQVSGPLFPSADNASNPCLIWGDGGLIPQNDFIEDQFADTYYVSATNPAQPERSFTVPVFRERLCSWRIDPLTAPDFFVKINGVPYGSLQYFSREAGIRPIWQLLGFAWDGTFASNQRLDTPVGPYNQRFSYGDIEVSE